MHGKNPKNWRLRAAAVILLLAGMLGGTLAWQSATQAGAPPFKPQVGAIFNKDQLQVAVCLPQNFGWGAKTGPLVVEVIDDDGKVAAGGLKVLARGDAPLSHRFNFLADKAKTAKARVRVSFRNETFAAPIDKVLLAKAHETTLTSGQEFYTGVPATFSCLVHGVRSLTETIPLIGSEVVVRLKDKDSKYQDLFKGRTNVSGHANVQFEMPEVEAGQYTLEVTTRSALGEEKLERAIRLKSDAKILLVSDKPIYQPGQLMHIRALVLRPIDMKPVANKEMLFEVEDSKGNKVFKKTLKTSEFGVASVDFQLADEVNMGDYHLRANVGEHRADKTVNVKRYVLPKFKVVVKADKTFYLPKEKIQAELQSDYFFGKAVSNAKVEVIASTFDVAFRQFHKWTGTTDAQGHAKFEIQLPDYFVGQPLQKGDAMVKLDVKVLDSADHSETVAKTYTVSDQPIRVSMIPEAGKLVPGVENRLFAAAIYPDGSPAANCEVTFFVGKKANQPAAQAREKPLLTATTNAAGLIEFRYVPEADQFRQKDFAQRDVEMLGGKQQAFGPNFVLDVRTEAKDAKGNTATQIAELSSQPFGENVLVRLDKAIYLTGDRMNIDIRSSAGLPTVYLDVVRAGQVMLSRWYNVKDGQATQQIDLPPNVFGSLEIHAYQMLSHGEIIRDSRVVYVQSRNDLKIDVQADKGEYLPGASGRLNFKVTDGAGKPTAAALGVMIVDEAVYALQEMQPGLEKVYFTLQEELLKPQVQIKFSPGETLDNLILNPAPRQQIAEVLLTAVKLPLPQRWEVNPAHERRQRVQGQVQAIGQGLFGFVWHTYDSFLALDKDTSKWTFRPNLLADALKSGHLHQQWLDGPFGGKLTLEEMSRLESSFTPDNLGQAVTAQRIQHHAHFVVQHTNQFRGKYRVKDRWVLPESILAEAVKQLGQDARMLKDAWGEPFRLVKRAKRAESLFGAQLDENEIVSAGPDRKFDTADDVGFVHTRPIQQLGWLGNIWFMDERDRWGNVNLGQELIRGRHFLHREMLRDFEMMRPQKEARGGFPVPLAGGIPMPVAKTVMKDDKAGEKSESPSSSGGAAPITKVRDYFPETMLWQPALITDDSGAANLAVNFADSITTWRLSASANSRAGALGGVNMPLKVFQDFFVDIDLPVTLTQSDEIAFPVAIYNYLKTPQTVRIELEKESWFELVDGALTRNLDLKPNEVTSVKFRIKAGKIGYQPLTVKAFGSKMSDAVKRVVEVVPNGQKFEKVISDRLAQSPDRKGGGISQTITIPDSAIPDASKLMVRIYPGVMAQVLEGVDGLIRLPGG